MVVIKRDGREVNFDKTKIRDAAYRALLEVDRLNPIDNKENLASRIANRLNTRYKRRNRAISVEEIQDDVETELMKEEAYDTAKAYIKYRYVHELMRNSSTLGEAQKIILINGSGLYHLLLSSNKPEARFFQRWITTEVLPSIHQNGGYILGQDSMDAVELANAAKQVAQNVLSERDRWIQDLRLDNEAQAALLREWESKVHYCDAALQSRGAIPISVIAKDYGLSAQVLNKYLHERGVQYKRAGTWLLYQPYADRGYTQTRTVLDGSSHSRLHTYWTPKGRAFLYDFLKADGILPQSERLNVPWDIDDFDPIHTLLKSGPQ